MAVKKIAIIPRLDHFKVYKQYYYHEQPKKVRLKGQFDKTALPGAIDDMPYFAMPVSKNRSRIINKNAHLAFYELYNKTEPRRVVLLRNQFGLQKLLIGRPLFLLVPSQKIERGSVFPKKLDHFKAYQVLRGSLIDKTVLLADQIDRQNKVEVEKPVLFCVPVAKTYGRKTTPVANPKAHLTFYSITPKIYRVPKASKDQFGQHKLLIATSVFLGVPSAKLDWEAVG